MANIYLHYVLDLWFEKVVRPNCQGKAYIVRYCDDFVCCFENKREAEAFYEALQRRLGKFNLEISVEKTRILAFGRKAATKSRDEDGSKLGTFDFLGFTHYCSWGKHGNFRVKRKTSRKKLRSSIARCKLWLKRNRNLPAKELMRILRIKCWEHTVTTVSLTTTLLFGPFEIK